MTKYIVQGGSPLFGEVHISGAKNAAVAILPAALLVDGVCRIENIPQISDVTVLLKILEQLGAKVRVLNRSDVELDCRHIVTTRAPQELAHKLRASYYLIGALLGRFGEAEVSMPGGCNFGGTRPIDQHVKGFAAMGATVREGDYICAAAEGGRMRGANIYLDVVSVGATMNIMMAAALADGTTVIENAAKEPPAPTPSASRAWSGCTAVPTPSSPTRSRRAPTWRRSPPPAGRSACAASSPSTWTASPQSCRRWAWRSRSRTTT